MDELHEVGEHVTGLDQLLGDLRRDAVSQEPVRDPLRPTVVPPDPLALRVVEATLEHRRAGRLGRRLGAPDVVRVHVRDEDPRDRAVEVREDLLPRRLHQAEARVDEQPAVVDPEEVAVHVPRPGRKGQRQPEDARLELRGD